MTRDELPQNIEAETAVLGSVLLNRDAIAAVAPWLKPEMFYLARHADIYRVMLDLYAARTPADTRTVSAELHRRGFGLCPLCLERGAHTPGCDLASLGIAKR